MDHDDLRIETLKRGDTDAILAMLERCSAVTLYNRLHGVTDGAAHALQVLANTAGHGADGAWNADRCIGLATLAVGDDGSAHVGVLVEDGWQRRGAGSALMAALAGRAREQRLPTLVADVLAHNQFIVPLLARVGPITTSVAYGDPAVASASSPSMKAGALTRVSPIGQEGKHADR
jgi:GNAT superfamily N-acetyltransferase